MTTHRGADVAGAHMCLYDAMPESRVLFRHVVPEPAALWQQHVSRTLSVLPGFCLSAGRSPLAGKDVVSVADTQP